ncbi:IS1595 family transposase, partial [Ruegeria sp.]
QVPILVAVDRGGTTACSVLPSVTADSIHSVLEPRIDDDILLVTDGNNVYPPCAKSLGVRHEALNQSAGERVRGVAHIQTANNRHSGLKDFLRRYRGVSSKYLENYLRWFERCDLLKSSARSCLATAIGTSCTQFAN